MSRRRLALRAVLASAVAVAAGGCRNGTQKPPDGNLEGGTTDGLTLPSLEVAVTGCASYEPVVALCDGDAGTGPRCTGSPPLSLSFSPVGSPQVTQFTWTFGDGTPSVTERAPSHTYLLPGCYQVRLVGLSNTGTVEPPQPQTIRVEELAIGAPCDVDAQCAGALECACAPGKGCAPAFTHGLCSAACDIALCGGGAVCAALAFAGGPDAGVPVRRARCVAACTGHNDCAVGFECSTLTAAGAAAPATWVRGCLPRGAQRDLGAPCRNENEVLDPDLCGTGVCADVGALGVCSASCDANRTCPTGATCARLRDGRNFCLAPCVTDDDCARDPLLACTGGLAANGGAGSVCAPRACTTDDDCAPSGRCGANVCVRR